MRKSIWCGILFFLNIFLFAQQPEIDRLFQQPQFSNDTLKRAPVIFDFGGSLLSQSVLPVKNGTLEEWESANHIFLWGNISFPLNIRLHISLEMQLFFADQNIVPTIHINRFFLDWENSFISIKAGRDIYSSYSPLAFKGTLDAAECVLHFPYVDIHALTGYSGLTGLFHPDYNDFNLTRWDKSYKNIAIKDYTIGNFWDYVFVRPINKAQSRRFFLLAEANAAYSFFHIKPYFITQLDFSKFCIESTDGTPLGQSNTDLLVNTFSIGARGDFRIIKSLYLFCDISGVFGYIHDMTKIYTLQDFNDDFINPKSSNKLPITSIGFQSEIRYDFGIAHNFVLSGGYAMGLGNSNDGASKDFYDFHTTEQENSSQFFYYGDFNGGFVLDPVLANIHSFSLKLQAKFFSWLSAYFYGFQTLKVFSNSPISDKKAVNNQIPVGTEIDAGVLFEFLTNIYIGIDTGLYFPEAAYNIHIPQFKVGTTVEVLF